MSFAGAAAAQTTVTTPGGTAGKIPVYTGTSIIGSSSITQSNGNVGIGTTNPAATLSVGSGSPFQVDAAGDLSQAASNTATSSNIINSPVHIFQASGWNESAGATDNWMLQNIMPAGTNSGSQLTFSHTSALAPLVQPLIVMNNVPVSVINTMTTSTPSYPSNAVAGFNSWMGLNANTSGNFTKTAIASASQLNVNLTGSGTNGYLIAAQTNQIEQLYNIDSTPSTAIQSLAIVDSNSFQIGAGSMSYGTVALSQSSLSLYNSSSNIGSLSLFSGSIYVPTTYTGKITNFYGLYLPDITGGTSNYGIYSAGGQNYLAGNTGVGTSTPGAALEVKGSLKLTAGSGGTITFADGTTQSTASTGSISTSNGVATVPGILQVTGSTAPSVTTQGGYFGWNALTGATDLINNQGSGTGGFAFLNTPKSGSPLTTLMVITGSGRIGIGTTTPGSDLATLSSPPASTTPIMEVNGDIALTQGNGGNIIYQDGTVQMTAWTGLLPGGDYAESVNVTGVRAEYEPGDVLVIDPSSPGRFGKSEEPYSTAVMGVYSSRPGVVGRRQKTDQSQMKEEIPMAMVGVVPTKVTTESGPIHPGDLLVTSSVPGFAMKGVDRSLLIGAIIGKALGNLDVGTGVIEVAVSLQ